VRGDRSLACAAVVAGFSCLATRASRPVSKQRDPHQTRER
jgi:hypothetical protein